MQATVAPPPPTNPRPEPRHKVSRSVTTQIGTTTPNPNPTRPRRTLSEDSSSPDLRVARAANTRTKSHGAVPRPKEKPSVHADVIDQMDISGLGTGMFHHDGPFDACAPSRNKPHKTHKAPIFAFEGEAPRTGPHGVPLLDKRLSPVAQATLTAMAQSDSSGPYPAGAIAASEHNRGNNNSIIGIKPSRKMTLTEAWGTAEPEPFEEFSAGTLGIHGRNSARSSLDQPADGAYEAMYRRDARAAARRGENLEVPRRNKIPPPQPIFLPGTRAPGAEAPQNGTQTPGPLPVDPPRPPTVQRSRSLMQRIRKMRENPNVPVGGAMAAPEAGYHSDAPYTPGGAPSSPWTPDPRTHTVREEPETPPVLARPTHARTHTRGTSKEQAQLKPAVTTPSSSGPYVLVDSAAAVAASLDKALPPPPPAPADNGAGYFDRPVVPSAQNGNGQAISRKISLYKKVKGVVGGKK